MRVDGVSHAGRGRSDDMEHDPRAVAASRQLLYGICRHLGQSRWFRRADDDLFDARVVRDWRRRSFHFWLAERSDLAAPEQLGHGGPVSPLPRGLAPTLFHGLELKGEYRLVTLFTRTGLITTNENPPFDKPTTTESGSAYNPNLPFLAAQQGVSGR